MEFKKWVYVEGKTDPNRKKITLASNLWQEIKKRGKNRYKKLTELNEIDKNKLAILETNGVYINVNALQSSGKIISHSIFLNQIYRFTNLTYFFIVNHASVCFVCLFLFFILIET